MADPTDTRDPVNRLLEGWGTPEAKPEFVDAVLARVDTVESAQRRRRRWGRALTFTVGGVAGGLVVAAVMSLAGAPTAPPSSARSLHLQAPGVAEVVGEPGSQLQWERREDGGYVLEVVEGVAWVRHTVADHELLVLADGEEARFGGACGRVEVTRTLLSLDASIDMVDCTQVDLAIAHARAELSDQSSR